MSFWYKLNHLIVYGSWPRYTRSYRPDRMSPLDFPQPMLVKVWFK